jgi:hypothetical protein
LCAEQRSDAQYKKREDFLGRLRWMDPNAGLRYLHDGLPWLRESYVGRNFTTQLEQILRIGWHFAGQRALRHCKAGRHKDYAADLQLARELAMEAVRRFDGVPVIERLKDWTALANLADRAGQADTARRMLEGGVALVKLLLGLPSELWEWALGIDSQPLDDPLRSLLAKIRLV